MTPSDQNVRRYSSRNHVPTDASKEVQPTRHVPTTPRSLPNIKKRRRSSAPRTVTVHEKERRTAMFDIHSHIIYHIDDGSHDLEESLELIRQDVEQGAHAIIATPHYYVQYPTDPARIRAKLATIEEANASALDVRLYAGNEVLYFDSMTERLQSGEILTLADSHYTLIEFYPEESYQTILRAIRNVRNAGYRPIIAHAERFKAMQEHGLAEVRNLGAYVQLSTEPLSHKGLSGLFDRETKFIQKALRNQEADFLGTDMHRVDRRPPVLLDAIDWIQKNLDADYADAVLQGNAEAILRDEEIY